MICNVFHLPGEIVDIVVGAIAEQRSCHKFLLLCQNWVLVILFSSFPHCFCNERRFLGQSFLIVFFSLVRIIAIRLLWHFTFEFVWMLRMVLLNSFSLQLFAVRMNMSNIFLAVVEVELSGYDPNYSQKQTVHKNYFSSYTWWQTVMLNSTQYYERLLKCYNCEMMIYFVRAIIELSIHFLKYTAKCWNNKMLFIFLLLIFGIVVFCVCNRRDGRIRSPFQSYSFSKYTVGKCTAQKTTPQSQLNGLECTFSRHRCTRIQTKRSI